MKNNNVEDVLAEALDDSIPIGSVLRKTLSLGSRIGSADLVEWAERELSGYAESQEDAVPAYRKIAAPLRAEVMTAGGVVTGQTIPIHSLPDFTREHVGRGILLTQSIDEIELLAEGARNEGGSIRLMREGFPMVVEAINAENKNPWQHVNAIYCSIDSTTLDGVTKQVRNSLIKVLTKMESEVPPDSDVPPAEAVNQAVNVNVYGGKGHKVTINSAPSTSSGSTVTQNIDQSGDDEELGLFGKLVGLATIIAAIVAVIGLLQGWF